MREGEDEERMVPRLTSGGSTAAGLAPRPLTDALGVSGLGEDRKAAPSFWFLTDIVVEDLSG
jgi:hypothetical protein